jgi:hypothetical protein
VDERGRIFKEIDARRKKNYKYIYTDDFNDIVEERHNRIVDAMKSNRSTGNIQRQSSISSIRSTCSRKGMVSSGVLSSVVQKLKSKIQKPKKNEQSGISLESYDSNDNLDFSDEDYLDDNVDDEYYNNPNEKKKKENSKLWIFQPLVDKFEDNVKF